MFMALALALALGFVSCGLCRKHAYTAIATGPDEGRKQRLRKRQLQRKGRRQQGDGQQERQRWGESHSIEQCADATSDLKEDGGDWYVGGDGDGGGGGGGWVVEAGAATDTTSRCSFSSGSSGSVPVPLGRGGAGDGTLRRRRWPTSLLHQRRERTWREEQELLLHVGDADGGFSRDADADDTSLSLGADSHGSSGSPERKHKLTEVASPTSSHSFSHAAAAAADTGGCACVATNADPNPNPTILAMLPSGFSAIGGALASMGMGPIGKKKVVVRPIKGTPEKAKEGALHTLVIEDS